MVMGVGSMVEVVTEVEVVVAMEVAVVVAMEAVEVVVMAEVAAAIEDRTIEINIITT